MKSILLLSHSNDYFTIDRVMDALKEQGIPCIRLNTDLFPEKISISQSVDAEGAEVKVTMEDGHFSSREIGAVWLRKVWSPKIETPMEEQYHVASVRESIVVRNALFQALADVPWLDSITAGKNAEDKYFQLRCAQQTELRIPKTLVSNDAEAVKQFYATLDGEMICKLNTSLSFGMQSNSFYFYTTRIGPADLEEMELLSVCPMIFQEEIPKAYELRVAYVDGACFTGKIRAKATTDWRKADATQTNWEGYELPAAIQEQLRQLMSIIGLSFGAIDLIRHTDGTYVFLEVNPNGEWGMLEKELDLPISKAIAAGLIRRLQTHSSQIANTLL